MLRQCPLDMFLNHRAGVILLGFQRVDDGRCRLAVSQRDGNVPEPAVVADPTNGGAGSFFQKFRFCPAKKLNQFSFIQLMANGEVWLGNRLQISAGQRHKKIGSAPAGSKPHRI